MIGINIAHKNGGNYFFPIPPLPQFFFFKNHPFKNYVFNNALYISNSLL